jgi:hypothetical protein
MSDLNFNFKILNETEENMQKFNEHKLRQDELKRLKTEK